MKSAGTNNVLQEMLQVVWRLVSLGKAENCSQCQCGAPDKEVFVWGMPEEEVENRQVEKDDQQVENLKTKEAGLSFQISWRGGGEKANG